MRYSFFFDEAHNLATVIPVGMKELQSVLEYMHKSRENVRHNSSYRILLDLTNGEFAPDRGKAVHIGHGVSLLFPGQEFALIVVDLAKRLAAEIVRDATRPTVNFQVFTDRHAAEASLTSRPENYPAAWFAVV